VFDYLKSASAYVISFDSNNYGTSNTYRIIAKCLLLLNLIYIYTLPGRDCTQILLLSRSSGTQLQWFPNSSSFPLSCVTNNKIRESPDLIACFDLTEYILKLAIK